MQPPTLARLCSHFKTLALERCTQPHNDPPHQHRNEKGGVGLAALVGPAARPPAVPAGAAAAAPALPRLIPAPPRLPHARLRAVPAPGWPGVVPEVEPRFLGGRAVERAAGPEEVAAEALRRAQRLPQQEGLGGAGRDVPQPWGGYDGRTPPSSYVGLIAMRAGRGARTQLHLGT